MRVRVSMFGPLRKYGAEVTCELEDGATVRDLRSALAEELSDEPLLARCVFATAEAIVKESSVVSSGVSYVVLPPVCGG
ncbi:MAG: MoaD/ThiS family protein [Deltaproteobacteria bacterium]|nr:MoaD/ThiS family protein [Deltaproteobacteria bacterium]